MTDSSAIIKVSRFHTLSLWFLLRRIFLIPHMLCSRVPCTFFVRVSGRLSTLWLQQIALDRTRLPSISPFLIYLLPIIILHKFDMHVSELTECTAQKQQHQHRREGVVIIETVIIFISQRSRTTEQPSSREYYRPKYLSDLSLTSL